MPKRKNFNTEAILKEVYPLVEKALSSRMTQWKQCMSNFMSKRSEMLFDNAPYDRIYYNDKDRDELYLALAISKDSVKEGIKHTYYWKIEPFKPGSAKDEVTIICLCMVRYFYLKKDTKNLELAMIYQSFSGKYYPSIHYGSFPTVSPSKYRFVMEYVVNHKLTQKYDLKVTGSVIGTVKSINNTWINSYGKDMIVKFDDEDVTYVIQQLYNRIKSFMKNIATLYYDAYEEKEYITYDKDSLPEEEGAGGYHLATNDTFKLQQYVERTMERINTSQVDYKLCKMASDANVRVEEVRSIFESIFNNKDNLVIVKEFITNMIATFMQQDQGSKDVVSVSFLKYATQQKPNSKDPLILRMKEIIDILLNDNSISYRKRKHRAATRASYQKMFLTYFAILIMNANRH